MAKSTVLTACELAGGYGADRLVQMIRGPVTDSLCVILQDVSDG